MGVESSAEEDQKAVVGIESSAEEDQKTVVGVGSSAEEDQKAVVGMGSSAEEDQKTLPAEPQLEVASEKPQLEVASEKPQLEVASEKPQLEVASVKPQLEVPSVTSCVTAAEQPLQQPDPPSAGGVVGILFRIGGAPTAPGESVVVTGALPEFGSWDPGHKHADRALRLKTSQTLHPRWSMSTPVFLELKTGSDKSAPETGSDKSAPEMGSNKSALETGSDKSAPEIGSNKSPPEAASDKSAPEAGSNELVIEYKFVIEKPFIDIDGNVISAKHRWEQIENRFIKLPNTGDVLWLVSDAGYDVPGQAALEQYPLAEFDLEAYCASQFSDRKDEFFE